MKIWILLLTLLITTACSGPIGLPINPDAKVNIPYFNLPNHSYPITSIRIHGSDIIVTGGNLDSTTHLTIKANNQEYTTTIVSHSETQVVARLTRSLQMAAGSLFDLIIGSAAADTVFTATFDIADGSIGIVKLIGVLSGAGVQTGQIPVWNGSAWTAATPSSSQIYVGSYNAATNTPNISATTPTEGHYYIVSQTGSQDLGNGSITYQVGDWIIFNGTSWDRIPSTNAISSVFGRTGAIVPQSNDYTWAQINKTTSSIGDIADVDLSGNTTGKLLSFNGSKWVPIDPPNVTPTAGSITDSMLAGSISQSKILNLSTDLAGKEPLLPTGTSSQYIKGDKSLGTLNTDTVIEGSNLYFTNTRAISALSSVLNNYVLQTDLATTNASISTLNTSLDNYALMTTTNSSNILQLQTDVSNLTTFDSGKLPLVGGTLSGDLTLNTQARFKDSTTNYVTIKAPNTVSSYTLTLPNSVPTTAGQVLSSDASGNTSWIAIPSAPVASVNGNTGSVVLTTSNITEGSNLYFTNARSLSSVLAGYSIGSNSPITQSDTIISSLGKLEAQISSKQGNLSGGTSNQYYRGDNSWQTLDTNAIPENTNLYFTNARVLIAPISGLTLVNSQIADSDTVLTAIGKAQGQINSITNNVTALGSKADLTNSTQTITALSITGLQSPISGSDATNKTYVDTKLPLSGGTLSGDLTISTQTKYKDSTTNYVTIKAPTTVSSYVLTLPAAVPTTTGQVLSSDTSGNTSWISIPSAPVSTVNGQTGAVVLTTSNILEGSNLYHTDARTLASVLSGFSSTNSVITASDTVLSAAGKAQGQISALSTIVNSNNSEISTKADTTNSTQIITALSITGLQSPLSGSDATNKNYVDTKLPLSGGILSGDLTINTQTKYKDSSSNYVTIKAPTSVTSYSLTLPTAVPTISGQVLSADTAGNTSWISIPSAPVSTVNGQTGSVVLTTTEITEGSNLYYTNNRGISSILTGYTIGTNSPLSNTDTIFTGIQKLEGQISTKQTTITAGTTAQYYRGDKSWVTLDTSVVPENTNLYFTTTRVLNTQITGFNENNSTIVGTDSILSAIGKAQGQITSLSANTVANTTAITNKADLTNANQNITALSVTGLSTPTHATDAANKTYVDTKLSLTGGTLSGDIILNTQAKFKDSTTNYVTIKAPNSVTSYSLILPTAVPTVSGQVLSSDTSGNTSWISIPSAPVSSVNGSTGTVVLTTSNISEGSNLYHTDARTLASVLSGFSATNSVITSSDTVLSAAGKAQGQISSLSTTVTANTSAISTKADTTNSTQTITALSITGLQAPVAGSDAANKTYVDTKLPLIGGTLSGDLTINTQTKYKDSSSNYVTIKAPTAVTSYSLTLPTAVPTVSGQVLAADTSGNTSWVSLPTVPVSSVNGNTGAVVLTTTNIAEGSNLYYTDARVLAASLSGFNSTNSVITASDNILSAVGKSQGQISALTTTVAGKEPTITNPNDTTKYYRGDKTFQTLNTAVVPESSNLYFTNARTLASTITAPTLTNSAITTGDTVQIAFGKLQAQFNNLLSTVLSTFTTGANSAITAADTILSAFGKIQGQLNNKADLSNSSQSVTVGTLTGTTINGTNGSWTSTGMLGIGTATPQAALDVSVTGTNSAIIVPRDTTANRPTATSGMIRYNTTNNEMEVSQGSTPTWAPVTPRWVTVYTTAIGTACTTGTCTTSGHPSFTSSTTTWSATGKYIVNYTGAPISTCMGQRADPATPTTLTNIAIVVPPSGITSSSITVFTYLGGNSSALTATNESFTLLCY